MVLSNNANATCNFDIDGNGVVEAKTDGLLLVRYLLGFRGAVLVADAVGTSPVPARSTPVDIEAFLAVNTYDLDGNGSTSALTDGVLLTRYLLGQTNGALTQGAIGGGSPSRPTGALIAAYILNGCSVTPPVAPGALNDTAILFGGSYPSGNNAGCTGEQPALQDCANGRDANGTLIKIGTGGAGFDFTKIGNGGQALPASATLGAAAAQWACTRDNWTGLTWEVKTTSGMRAVPYTYSWFVSSNALNGGLPGTADGGSCAVPGRCDIEKYVVDVNALNLCGQSDWRLPTIKELEGIADLGRTNPAIDPTYFPNSASALYWTGTPAAVNITSAWSTDYQSGYSLYVPKSRANPVRLVRSAP